MANKKSVTPGMISVEAALVADSILPNLREKLRTAKHKLNLHQTNLNDTRVIVKTLENTIESLEKQIPEEQTTAL